MSSPRILIVDDDRTARVLLERLLTREGFEVISCGDGREAMQLVDTAHVSLIVSDYEMPEFTGAQLCELVRQSDDPELASLPIILLTAHAGEQHEIESLQSGANDFVTKPVNTAVLKARIETHLGLHALRRELEEWRRLHEMDLEAAQITQRAILPSRAPRVVGWESAAHYQPVIQVGGDMYDWLRLADGSWLFWIADATGHGASAALLTSLTKLVFRHAAGEFSTPGEILCAVNAEFYSIFRGKSFMTAGCVVVQPDSGRLSFAGMGHPPLLVVRAATGAVESFPSQGPPLGILAEQNCGETPIETAPGEVVLLYTDGLYSGQDSEGEHALPQDLIAGLPKDAASAEEFLDRVVEIAGEEIPDDMAVIVLRRVTEGAR